MSEERAKLQVELSNATNEEIDILVSVVSNTKYIINPEYKQVVLKEKRARDLFKNLGWS